MPKATPSSTDQASTAGSVSCVRPNSTPRAFASLWGVRSPDRYGRNSGASRRAASGSASMRASRSASPDEPVSFVAHARLDAADSITDIWCQRPGTAWQNACTAEAGFGRKRSLTTNTTPLVPSETKPSPGRTAPMPTALAALSPPPPATTTPRGRPHAAAMSSRTVPLTALPSTSSGMCERVSPVSASSSSDQRRAATSSHSVPAASDISPTKVPHRRYRR